MVLKKKLLNSALAAFLAVAMVFTMTPMFAFNAYASNANAGITKDGRGVITVNNELHKFTADNVDFDIDYAELNKMKDVLYGDTEFDFTSAKGQQILKVFLTGTSQELAESEGEDPDITYYPEGYESDPLVDSVDFNDQVLTFNQTKAYGQGGYTFTDSKIKLADGDNTIALRIGGYQKNSTQWSYVSYKISLKARTVTYKVSGSDVTWQDDSDDPVTTYQFSDSPLNISVTQPGDPKKLDGSTFLGWTTEATSSSVVSQLPAGNSDVTLYPVFKDDGGTTVEKENGEVIRYDNTHGKIDGHEFLGNIVNVDIDYSKLNKISSLLKGETYKFSEDNAEAFQVNLSGKSDEESPVTLNRDLTYSTDKYGQDGYTFNGPLKNGIDTPSSVELKGGDSTVELRIGGYVYKHNSQNEPQYSWVGYNIKMPYHKVTYSLGSDTDITWNTNDTERADIVTYKFDNAPLNLSVTKPADPVKKTEISQAPEFVGWATSENSKDVISTYSEAKDVTLYPVFNSPEKVTFNINDKDLSNYVFMSDPEDPATEAKSTVIETNTKGIVKEPAHYLKETKDGETTYTKQDSFEDLSFETDDAVYRFDGWSTNQSGTAGHFDFNTPVNGPTTLYAQWIKTDKYTVNFDLNLSDEMLAESGITEETVAELAEGQTVEKGHKITAPETPNTTSKFTHKSGTQNEEEYYFNGWNTAKDGTGDDWVFTSEAVTKTQTLYAQWATVKYYTVVFDDNVTKTHAEPDFEDYVYGYVPGSTSELIPDFAGTYTTERILASEKVQQPTFVRGDYSFESWYSDPEFSDGSLYYDKKSLQDNDAANLANEDNTIILYAKWKPLYGTDSSVLIKTPILEDGIYSNYYSQFIVAKANSVSAARVYRNFILTDASGDALSAADQDLSKTIRGLHLNSRTGEVYGVPEAAGEYVFYVRLANDNGQWTSKNYAISLTIDKVDMTVDLKADAEQYSKIYGDYDPAEMYSIEANLDGGTGVDNDDKTIVFSDKEGTVEVTYHYASDIAAAKKFHDGFLSSDPSTYDRAADLAEPEIPENISDLAEISLDRVDGEDAGLHKRYISLLKQTDHSTDVEKPEYDIDANYAVDKGPLGDQNAKDAEGKAYKDVYSLRIDQKEGVTFEGEIDEAEYIYGQLLPGDEVEGIWSDAIRNQANGVNPDPDRIEVGVEDAGTATLLAADKLAAKDFLSGAGRLKATPEDFEYTNKGDSEAMAFSSANSWNIPDVSTTATEVTTQNYADPELSLTVARRGVEVLTETPDIKVTMNAMTEVTQDKMDALIYLQSAVVPAEPEEGDAVDPVADDNSGILAGDDVSIDITKAHFIIEGTEYDYDGAIAKLTELARTPGDYTFTVKMVEEIGDAVQPLDGVLKGADAANYYAFNNTDVTLHVVKGVFMAKASSYKSKYIKVSWTAVEGASSYTLKGTKCTTDKLKTIKTTSSKSYTVKKISGKSLKKHTPYKFVVTALNADGEKICNAAEIHVLTTKTGAKKTANVTSVTAKPESADMAVGDTLAITPSQKVYKGKKWIGSGHAPKYRYESSDPSVASVDENGNITAVSGGPCTIYTVGINGMWDTTDITVTAEPSAKPVIPHKPLYKAVPRV